MDKTSPQLKPLFTPDEIRQRVWELGQQISNDYAKLMQEKERPLVLLGILKGSFMFLADLAREINIPVEIQFATLSSYGNETVSSGDVQLQLSPPIDLKGRNILVVEDIADTGRSLTKLMEHLDSFRPESVRICAFLNKPEARVIEISLDYVGFDVPMKYVVGYGLDAAQHYRQLAGIYELNES